ncbi:hypothetical protein HMPREF0204_12665 [Chryseobacterium gleum ATCC 35910]|uniref:Uncharacterized protein n=1 Tax=Chryseobacterium gleum ATCC 35910 TaxID=525257 RepID=A0ABN0AKL8_CHRGE|nr:hypothetical protein HMPREF0204_12665 [Chryseobacterium gleum ATCC 35910]
MGKLKFNMESVSKYTSLIIRILIVIHLKYSTEKAKLFKN